MVSGNTGGGGAIGPSAAAGIWAAANSGIATIARRAGIMRRERPVRIVSSGCPRDERALRQSTTERAVLARAFGELDQEVIGRDSGSGDDPRVELLEQGEAGFFGPARHECQLEQHKVVRVAHPKKRRRVQETVARKLVDDLKKVVRRDL